MLWLGSELLYGFGARMHLYAAAGQSLAQLSITAFVGYAHGFRPESQSLLSQHLPACVGNKQ